MKRLLVAMVVALAGRAEAQCNSTSAPASCGSVPETVCEDVSTATTTCSIGSCSCGTCDPTCVENCAEAACAGGGIGGGSGGGSGGTTPPACSTALCGGDCCGSGQSCCGGSCCDGDCCSGTCVASGGTCCGSIACYDGDQCCNGSCVASGGTCCGSAACYGGDQCCNDQCTSAVGPCCGSGACEDGEQCCNDQCTSASDVCCPGTICPPGQTCPQGGGDCGPPSGATSCGGSDYCPQVEACIAATPDLVAGSFVCIDGIACGSGYCPSDQTCSNGVCLAPGSFPCGAGYCNGNQQCCGGSCISSSQICCSSGGTNWICNNGLTCQSCVVNNQSVYSCGACPGGTPAGTGTAPTQGTAPLPPDAGTPATSLSSPVQGSPPTPGTAPSNTGGGSGRGPGSYLGLGFSCGGSGSGGKGDGGSGDGGKSQTGPTTCSQGTLTVVSGAGTQGAVSSSRSEALFNGSADDAGVLSFVPAEVGSGGSDVVLPTGYATGTQVINVTQTQGSSGFFRVTFTLPAGFGTASLQGAANVEANGRVFLNDVPLTPPIGQVGAVNATGSVTFSANSGFLTGTNTLEVSDYDPSGPSGAAFYANVAYARDCSAEADLPPAHGLFAEQTFLLFGLAAFTYRKRKPT